MEEAGDVEFESPHLHQQGLVTDQALCLARGLPPGRRYTPSRISRLAHVWRRSWTRRAAGRPVAPPRSAYGASPDGRPEGGQLAGVVEELPIGVPGRGLEAGRRLYQRSAHSPKFTPPAAGSTSAPRSLASSTPSRTARRRACGRSSWSAAGPPGRASVPAGGCDLGRAGCLSGPPRRPALPPALELAGLVVASWMPWRTRGCLAGRLDAGPCRQEQPRVGWGQWTR
jgi:hypothetical protein